MASDQTFVDYVMEQIDFSGEIRARKMFGEYGIYANGKLFALICDNKLFFKPTEAGRAFIKNVVEASPYPGAKKSFLIETKLEDRVWISKLLEISLPELPFPKPRKKNAK